MKALAFVCLPDRFISALIPNQDGKNFWMDSLRRVAKANKEHQGKEWADWKVSSCSARALTVMVLTLPRRVEASACAIFQSGAVCLVAGPCAPDLQKSHSVICSAPFAFFVANLRAEFSEL